MWTSEGEEITVLHVDDDSDLSDLAADFLQREDDRFFIVTAASASEGLEYLAECDVDCIISDYDMPGMNGIEFLEVVREDRPDLPFILYTGKGSEAVASSAISAGVTDYMQKERGTDQYTVLANRIRNAVERYWGLRERRRRRRRQRRQRKALRDLTTDDTLTDGDFDLALERITETATDVLDVSRVNVWLFDDEKCTLRCVDQYDRASGDHEEGMELIADDYPGYFDALEAHRAIDADDALEDPRTAELAEYLETHDVGALLDATLRSEGEVVGVVCHEHVGSERQWTDDEVQFASDVAELVHRALRNRRRCKHERELERIERRYRAIFEDPHILAGLIDVDGTLLEANQTALEYIDTPASAVIGEPFWETPWWDEEDRQLVQQKIERAVDGEYVDFEANHTRSDGDRYNVEGVIRPVTDGGGEVVSLFITAHDVTQQKDRERRLQRQKTKIKALHDVATEIETYETSDAVYDAVVDAAESILEFDIAIVDEADDDLLVPKAVSSSPSAEQYYDTTPIDADDNFAAEVYRTGDPSVVEDLRTHDVAPADTTFRSALTVPIGEYGVFQTVSKTVSAFDETDLELTELLVAHGREQLSQIESQRRLAERTAKLERQNERLDKFARIVSHDLRNPLNVAEGQLELVKEDCANTHLEEIEWAHHRMRTLIEDLLTLAREGVTVDDLEVIDLEPVIEECCRNVDMAETTLLADVGRSLRADGGRLQQLLENLFRNAVEHGGKDVTVTVGELDDGFYVEDDGPGISEAERGEVFEPGYSLADDGTGFGLAIVQEIVEAHEWEITVTANTDGGARFEIRGVEFVE